MNESPEGEKAFVIKDADVKVLLWRLRLPDRPNCSLNKF